jgi:hypothetical protein
MKNYTDLEQSKKLAEILSLESADMHYNNISIKGINYADEHRAELMEYNRAIKILSKYTINPLFKIIPCWSLAALLGVLSKIKPQVYTPILFPSEGKWILQFAEYGHGNVCEVTCDNPVDACVAMVEKLHELKMLQV